MKLLHLSEGAIGIYLCSIPRWISTEDFRTTHSSSFNPSAQCSWCAIHPLSLCVLYAEPEHYPKYERMNFPARRKMIRWQEPDEIRPRFEIFAYHMKYVK